MSYPYIQPEVNGRASLTNAGKRLCTQVLAREGFLDIKGIAALVETEGHEDKAMNDFVDADVLRACKAFMVFTNTCNDIHKANFATEINAINIYMQQLQQLVDSKAKKVNVDAKSTGIIIEEKQGEKNGE